MSAAVPVPGPVAGPQAIYTGRTTNWPLVLLSTALLVPLLLMSKGSDGSWAALAIPLLLVAAGVALEALTGSSVRTTAGPKGVTVAFGAIGWPRCTYPLDRIARAEVIDLSPWWVAGGFWWTPRRTCCTVRSGPTLRLWLTDGRSVTVSTPDPAAAVDVIDRARTP